MIRVAYASTRELSTAELARLPVDERTREFGSAERRRQFLSARLLLREMLSGFEGRPPERYRITRDEQGKPACEGGPAFSIAHTRDYVACCIADAGDVGVDLEAIDARRRVLRVALRFFTAPEADWLATQPPDRFFMLWVLKEAYGKATGSGVVDAFKSLQCIVEPPRIEVLEPRATSPDLRLFRLHDNYLAVAGIGAAPGTLEVERWDAGQSDFLADDEALEVARN